MDWLLTVPFAADRDPVGDEAFRRGIQQQGLDTWLGLRSHDCLWLLRRAGRHCDLTPRWMCWFLSMGFFLYIVYELLVGLAAATNSETDPVIKGKIQTAQVMTVISWCTYPVVYLFPMLGINAATAVVSIQIGYCVSDIISKCGVGLVIYQITYAKSNKEGLLR